MNKLDLPTYDRIEHSHEALFGDDDTGDLDRHRRFRASVGVEESGSLSLLKAWGGADLFFPLWRTISYGVTGEEPEDPYRPGDWTVKTTAYLSPAGPALWNRRLLFRAWIYASTREGRSLLQAIAKQRAFFPTKSIRTNAPSSWGLKLSLIKLAQSIPNLPRRPGVEKQKDCHKLLKVVLSKSG